MTDLIYTTIAGIEQCRPLWEHAVLLAELTQGFKKRCLYQLEGDYIEVTWHVHFNVVLKVARFTNTDLLEPYLDSIAIDHLLNEAI